MHFFSRNLGTRAMVRAIALTMCLAAFPSIGFANDVDDALNAAQKAIDGEQLDTALGLLSSVTPETPAQTARVDHLIGKIYLQVGKPDKAMEFFEHAAASTMDDAEIYAGMARAALGLGKLTRARSHANSALRGDKDLAAAHLVLAQVDARLGKVEDAKQRFADLARDRADNEDIAVAHAEFLFNRGEIEPAIRRLEDFTLRHSSATQAYDALGRYLWSVGRQDEALRARTVAAVNYADQGNGERSDAIMAWVKLRDGSGRYVKAFDDPKELYRDLPNAAPPPRPKQQARPMPSPLQGSVKPIQVSRPDPLPIPPGATYSQGTGFVVGEGRYVITNHHVINGTKNVAVRNGLGQVRHARVIKIGDKDDLAVLELASPFPSDQSIPTAQMGDARAGRKAIVLGYPMAGVLGEQMPSLTDGVVSKTSGFQDDPSLFLLSTKVNKGNSGGPVLDDRGNLIGVVVSKLDTIRIYEKQGFIPEDVNQAIKISRVFALMGWSGGTTPAPDMTAPMAFEDLYQNMLSKVVMVVGVLEKAGK